jgi:outer membrane protein OmpA-like peptidoglycan-associated protein
MSPFLRSGLGRRAIASSCIALLLGNPALAQMGPTQMGPTQMGPTQMGPTQMGPTQTVRVFDDVPSIEQLRSIMVPESQPGIGRSIVIQRPDAGTPSTQVQRVATQVLPAPRTPVAAAGLASPTAETVAASVAAPLVQATSGQATSGQATSGQASNTEAKPSTEAKSGGEVKSNAAAKAGVEAKANTDAKPGTVGFRINFGFDSAVLPEQAHAMIDRVAELMREAPEIKVRVEGHTDAIGSADYNVALSERRAVSVAEYLVRHGIEPSRLVLVGKGMADPLTRNPYDPNNRRVQFVRIG